MPPASVLILLAVLVNVPFVSAISSSSGSFNGSSSWSPSTRSCSAQEITIMRKLYIGVAATTACASGSTVDMYEIYVTSECTSLCTSVLQNLEEALPDCNYYLSGYEDSNKKWDAYSSLAQCAQWVSPAPAWVRFHSNKTISVPTASSASGSAIMDAITAPSSSGSEFVGSTSSAPSERNLWFDIIVVALTCMVVSR